MKPKHPKLRIAALIAAGLVLAAVLSAFVNRKSLFMRHWSWTCEARAEETQNHSSPAPVPEKDAREKFLDGLVSAALERTRRRVVYDPSYVVIPYPGGDVPADRGVCSDVVIRSYRAVGVDLQKEVHEDMRKNFSAYPQLWGLTKPDSNIDHRRVQNLMVFFKRHGEVLPITENPDDYRPGDIVCWDLSKNLRHIGIVTDRKSPDRTRPLIVHNIGAGPSLDDMLFDYRIIGHFRCLGPAPASHGESGA